MKRLILSTAILFLGFVFPAFSQSGKAVSASNSGSGAAKSGFMPLNDVREGMSGRARTVFQGTKSEEFSVEILGVLPGAIGPKQDLIVGKISGGGADRTKVFAGMSGSPVYIDGKLVGAISYAFPFSSEAICGITPIEQMISIFEESGEKRSENRKTYSFAELASNEWKPYFPQDIVKTGIVGYSNGSSAVSVLAGQGFRPIATPLSFSGFSAKTLDAFGPDFQRAGLLPVVGISGGSNNSKIKTADDSTLVGGDSVTVELSRGDFSLAASGTVTHRDGDKVYAFGHPFLSLGTSSLPMSESSVVVVVPSLSNSFKLAVSDALVGSMTQDRATGIYGSLGKSPRMIPVRLKMTTSRNREETFEYEVASDEFLTPFLLNITVFNAITAQERGIGNLTVEVDGKIKLKDNDSVNISGRYAGQAAIRLAAGSIVMPAFNLFSGNFSDFAIDRIDLDIRSTDESKTANLQRIAVDRVQAKPGEVVELEAFIRTDSGKLLSQKIPFRIPADAPAGKLKLTIGDGSTVQMLSADQQFEPQSLAELVATINRIKKNDRLYVQAIRVTTGAIIGASELPNLPPSVLATLNSNRTSGVYKPTVESVIAELEVAQSGYVITGRQEVEISVVN